MYNFFCTIRKENESNIVSFMFRRAKDIYFQYTFNDAIDDTRKTRRLLNNLVNKSHSKNMKGIFEIRVGDYMIEDSAKTAENIISHFSSI